MFKKVKKKISLLHKQLLLLGYYSAKINWNKPTDKKRIIICFDGLFSHGGLVDRLKGIVSFYEIAKKLDYDFFIYFNHPFALSHFLKSNSIPWEIRKEQLQYHPFGTKILYLMNDFSTNPLELIKRETAKTIFVYSNVDYLKTIYPDKTEVDLNAIWRKNYKELFIESEVLQSKIEQLPQEKKVIFHTRFTSLMGDFKDTTTTTLNTHDQQKLMEQLVEKIKKTALLHPTMKPYVLSDSLVFLKYITTHTSFGVLEGNPKHIEIDKDDQDLSSQYKTFTDFYFMTKSDALYLLQLKPMYNSSFSKYAAIIGAIPFTILQE